MAEPKEKCYCYESEESDETEYSEEDIDRHISGVGTGEFLLYSLSGKIISEFIRNIKKEECFYVLCEDLWYLKDEIIERTNNVCNNIKALIATHVHNSDSVFFSEFIRRFPNLEVVVFAGFISAEEIRNLNIGIQKSKFRPMEVMDDGFFTDSLLESLRSRLHLKAIDLRYKRSDISSERIRNVVGGNVAVVLKNTPDA